MKTVETHTGSGGEKDSSSPTIDFEYLYLLMEQRQIEFNLTSGEVEGL